MGIKVMIEQHCPLRGREFLRLALQTTSSEGVVGQPAYKLDTTVVLLRGLQTKDVTVPISLGFRFFNRLLEQEVPIIALCDQSLGASDQDFFVRYSAPTRKWRLNTLLDEFGRVSPEQRIPFRLRRSRATMRVEEVKAASSKALGLIVENSHVDLPYALQLAVDYRQRRNDFDFISFGVDRQFIIYDVTARGQKKRISSGNIVDFS